MPWFRFMLTIGIMLVAGLIVALYQEQSQPEIIWSKQWGTVEEEWIESVVIDEQSNIYIAGLTKGDLFEKNQGDSDVFIIKLSSDGKVLWSKQFGTSKREDEVSICIDTSSESIYLVATTEGSWFSENLGEHDIVLLKLSVEGQLIWGKHIGTEKDEVCVGVTVDSQGYIYLVGSTRGNLFGQYQSNESDYESFLAKFDSYGNLIWGKQFSYCSLIFSIVTDAHGNICIVGQYSEPTAALLAKYTSDGTLIWKQIHPPVDYRQEGGHFEEEAFESLSIDKTGNIYIVGRIDVFVDENLLISRPDALLAKYEGASGERLWFKRLKSAESNEEISEEFNSITTDKQGNVYAVGFTKGSLFGNSLGDSDIVIAKFDSEGNIIWGKQWGTDKEDEGIAITVDRNGNIYVAGNTKGNLFGINAGETDIFVVKFRQ